MAETLLNQKRSPRLPQAHAGGARLTFSWSSGHQRVPTDAEHHRHHHQHSQHCAHHRFLNSSVSLLSGAGSWLSGGGRGDPERNDYVGSAGTAVTIAQRVIFRAGSVYT
jgi:hypothetical protein